MSYKMFFSHKEITFFWGKHCRIFLHIVDFYPNGFKVQIAVSMQLQKALHDPSQGIRVLSNEMIGHFLKQNNIYILFLTTDSRIQSVYCHVHSEEKQVSLYNEILSLLSTLNAKNAKNKNRHT